MDSQSYLDGFRQVAQSVTSEVVRSLERSWDGKRRSKGSWMGSCHMFFVFVGFSEV